MFPNSDRRLRLFSLPFGRLRRGDFPCNKKSRAADSPKSGGAEGVEGAIGKPPRRLRRGKIPAQQYRNRQKEPAAPLYAAGSLSAADKLLSHNLLAAHKHSLGAALNVAQRVAFKDGDVRILADFQ